MKLSRRTFRIFWDVHAWGGVLSALALHVMVFCGAFALFHPELDYWSMPRATLRAPGVGVRLDPLVEQLAREEKPLVAQRLAFELERAGVTGYLARGGPPKYFYLDATTARLEPARSSIGSFLYGLHYLRVVPRGIYVAGFVAMAFLLAVVTGLFIHAKDLVRQWFRFRPEHAPRTWSSDLHKVLGVFGLPYQLLYAWTGAVLCLAPLAIEPAVLRAVFRGHPEAARAVQDGGFLRPMASGRPNTTLPSLDAFVGAAKARYPGFEPDFVALEHVGDADSYASVYGAVPGVPFGTVELAFRAEDGSLLHAHGPGTSTAWQRFNAWFFGLHFARFGGYGVKALYAALALLTCVVIVTGNVVWLERRDTSRSSGGNRILERLTTGVAAGLATATSALFAANRLLPGTLESRGVVEEAIFWGAWAGALMLAFGKSAPRRIASIELILAGALFALAVAADAVLRPDAFDSWLHRGVLGGLSALSAGCALLGARLGVINRRRG